MEEPVFIGLLFADKIITEDNGKKSIIGTFSVFNSKVYPVVFPPWFIYAGFTNIQGKHEFAINLVKDDSQQVILPISGQFDSKDRANVVELTFAIGGAVFPGAGIYSLTFHIDGKQVGSRILQAKDVVVQENK